MKETQESIKNAIKELHEDFEFPDNEAAQPNEYQSAKLAEELSKKYDIDSDVI
jgi:hypothetical protein